MRSPMDPLAVVAERLGKVMAEQGLAMRQFVAIPGPPGGPHHVQAVFILDDEADPKKPSTAKDDEFDAIIEADAKAEQERRAAEAEQGLKDLQQSLKDGRGGGIGLDDD